MRPRDLTLESLEKSVEGFFPQGRSSHVPDIAIKSDPAIKVIPFEESPKCRPQPITLESLDSMSHGLNFLVIITLHSPYDTPLDDPPYLAALKEFRP